MLRTRLALFAMFVSCIPVLLGSAGAADTVGAKALDASDFPSIQAALDALPESGGIVRVPPGTYRIAEPILIEKSNVRLEGSGAATHFMNCNQEGKPAILVKAKDPAIGVWQVQLANFRVSGDAVKEGGDNRKNAERKGPFLEPPKTEDGKPGEPVSGDGIAAYKAQELLIQSVAVDHCGRHGIYLEYCEEDGRVCDSIITYCRATGLHCVGIHDLVVSANQFEENHDAVQFLDGYNLCMNGNNIDDHTGNGVIVERTYGSVLSGNMIEECAGVGLIMDRDCYGITVSANVFADNFGGGIDLRDAWGCAVSANTFVVDSVRSLIIGPAAGRITVTGNNFCDSFAGDPENRRHAKFDGTGILLNGTTDNVICGNQFSGLTGYAIETDGKCTRQLIANNIVTDMNPKTIKTGPAFRIVDEKEVVLQGNVLP